MSEQHDIDTPEIALLDSLNRALKVTIGALKAAHASENRRSHSAQLADTIIDIAKALQSLSACYRKALLVKLANQKLTTP